MEAQKERRKKFNALYSLTVLDRIAREGIVNVPNTGPDTRSWVWNTLPLFEEGHYSVANKVIREVELKHCTFMPMMLTQILHKHEKQLEADVKEKAENYVRNSLDYCAGDDIHISMYNDNFAGMAIYTLICAGGFFGLGNYVAIGKKKLEEVCDLFRRCGTMMEYGSPTYSPINILCYAEIANHTRDSGIREMALMCEERLWIEIATHYHAPTGRLAGPYSRAYIDDTVGHPANACAMFWIVLGDAALANPIDDMLTVREKQATRYVDGLALPNSAWILNADYHFPNYLAPVALDKKYPYEAEFMVECIPSDGLAYNNEDEPFVNFGGHRSVNYTYMNEEFAVGTAQNQFHAGSITDAFHITYKNRARPEDFTHTGVIFSRYIFNDKRIQQAKRYAYFGECGENNFRDEGRKFGLQHHGTAMVVYKPLHLERKAVTSAKLSIILPVHYFKDFEIYAGDVRVDDYHHTSAEPVTVFVRAHNSCFAFLPLKLTDLGRKTALKIELEDDYLLISFYNYEGPQRLFGIKELLNAQTGFVCIARTLAEAGSFENFTACAREAQIDDRLELSAKMYTRRIKYKDRETELYFVYNPETESVIVNTANKKPKGLYILKADMIEHIPFL